MNKFTPHLNRSQVSYLKIQQVIHTQKKQYIRDLRICSSGEACKYSSPFCCKLKLKGIVLGLSERWSQTLSSDIKYATLSHKKWLVVCLWQKVSIWMTHVCKFPQLINLNKSTEALVIILQFLHTGNNDNNAVITIPWLVFWQKKITETDELFLTNNFTGKIVNFTSCKIKIIKYTCKVFLFKVNDEEFWL